MTRSSRHTLSLWLLLAMGGLLLGILFWRWPLSLSSLSPSPRETAIKSEQGPMLEHWVYHLQYSGKIEGQAEGFRLEGEMHWLVPKLEKEGQEALIFFTESSLRGQGPQETWQKELWPSLIQGRKWRLRGLPFAWQEEGKEQVKELSRFWLRLSQRLSCFAAASALTQETWQQEEWQGEQLVQVSYTRQGKQLSKEWQTPKEAPSGSLGQGEWLMHEQGTMPVSLSYRDKEWRRWSKQMIRQETELSLTFSSLKTLPQAEALALFSSLPQAPLSQQVTTRTWAELRDKLRQPQASMDDYLDLKQWIAAQANLSDQLLAELLSFDAEDPLLKPMIRALAAVGNEASQQLLLELLATRLDQPELAQKIISTLSLLADPKPSSEQAFWRLSEDKDRPEYQQASLLGLGIMAQKLSQSKETEAQSRSLAIEDRLWLKLSATKDQAMILDTLAALGNLGPRRRDRLNPWLQAQDEAQRAAAFFALRFSPLAEANEVLNHGFFAEPSRRVKQKILESFCLRRIDESWWLVLSIWQASSLSDAERLKLAHALARAPEAFRLPKQKAFAEIEGKLQTQEARLQLAALRRSLETAGTM